MTTISVPEPTATPTRASGPADAESSAHSVLDSVSELVRVIQFRDRDRACCHGVSVSQCYALEGLDDQGPMTVNDLAAYLYVDKSTASRIANGLVERGLAVRGRSSGDGRVVRLTCSEAGRDLAARIREDLHQEYVHLLAEFDPEVRRQVARLIGRLARAFAARVDTSGGSCCAIR